MRPLDYISPDQQPFTFERNNLSVRRDDQLAAQHVHAASKRKLARLVRRKFNRRCLERRQIPRYMEIAEDDLLAARSGFITVKIEAHGRAFFNDDHIGRVAAFDSHLDFLHAARAD